jgi:hypothetical protein|tara:strand:- start:14849 stop:15112 length:264 start_codon:yes stop_codon:yes gene_type:complete
MENNYVPKDGSGNCFINDFKTPENNQPDFRGDLTLNGKTYELAMWKKLTSAGKPMLSINAKDKVDKPQPTQTTSKSQPERQQADSSW